VLKEHKKNLVFNMPPSCFVSKARYRILKEFSQHGFGVVAPKELEAWLKS
jgi:hypothetical protein